jgi:transposase-like protein
MVLVANELKRKRAEIGYRIEELRAEIALLERQRSAFDMVIQSYDPAYTSELAPLAARRHKLETVDTVSALFKRSTQAVLYWHPSSRESWSALLPFTLFTENHRPARISWKLIFRNAKTVPVVTENSRRQAWHLKWRRRIS